MQVGDIVIHRRSGMLYKIFAVDAVCWERHCELIIFRPCGWKSFKKGQEEKRVIMAFGGWCTKKDTLFKKDFRGSTKADQRVFLRNTDYKIGW